MEGKTFAILHSVSIVRNKITIPPQAENQQDLQDLASEAPQENEGIDKPPQAENQQDQQDLASEASRRNKAKCSRRINRRPVVDKGIFSAFDRNGVKKFVLEER